MKASEATDHIVTAFTICLFFGCMILINNKKIDSVSEKVIVIQQQVDSVQKQVDDTNQKLNRYIPLTKLSDPIVYKETLNDFDYKQIDCLARNIYFEARNQPLKGQVAVAFVTFNRTMNTQFPGSFCKVVYQGIKDKRGNYLKDKCSFSWVCDGKSDKIKEPTAWTNSYKVAYNFYIKNHKIKDMTKGATYYHSTKVRPRWAKSFMKTIQVGMHIFYKDSNG